jgi:hypothetical protein
MSPVSPHIGHLTSEGIVTAGCFHRLFWDNAGPILQTTSPIQVSVPGASQSSGFAQARSAAEVRF